MLVPLTVSDLADFAGTSEASYSAYVSQALAQATLLFEVATGLEEYPDNQSQRSLAQNAILEMADRLYTTQPYAAALASPFSSESIGSYSYSKASSAISKGQITGVVWFDLAVQKLAVRPVVESTAVPLFEAMPVWPDGSNVVPNARPYG